MFSLKTLLKYSLIPLLLQALTAHAAITVTKIAQGCAANHSLFLKSDGSLWAMGDNSSDQLGDGTFYNAYRPEEIVAASVVAIAAGGYHSLFLKSDGSLWAMGGNGSGELGDGTWIYLTSQPEEIVASGVTAIAAGKFHSLFLKCDGSLWAMGDNSSGELGNGTYSSNEPFDGTNKPVKIVTSGVTAIAAGDFHSLFLKSDGSLWAMGDNQFGELGDGTYGVAQYYYATNQPEEIVASNVTAIAAGGHHSLFLKSDGSLWAMGWNGRGQLGDGTSDSTNRPEEIVASNVIAISAGENHSMFIKSDGSLWAMGYNAEGQLGDGTYNLATNQPEEIVASGVTAIAAAATHSLFLKSDGSLWAMGEGSVGQLGDGFGPFNYSETILPEQICPSPQPVLVETISSNTNLQFTATCGFGGNFYLLAGTNLAQPLSQWIPVWTNVIADSYNNNFSVTLTNAVNSGSQQFFILQSQ